MHEAFEMHRDDVRSFERVAHQFGASIVGFSERALASEAGSPESRGDYLTRADCSRIAWSRCKIKIRRSLTSSAFTSAFFAEGISVSSTA